MTAEIIDGKAISQKIIEEVTAEIASGSIKPHLVAIQCGEDPASMYYVNSQKKKAEAVGIQYTLEQLPAETSQEQLMAKIDELNKNPEVTGMILQMPVPEGVDRRAVQQAIDYKKDVEGITPTSLGLLMQDRPAQVPCTAMGAVELLHAAVDELQGLDVTIVGRSEIVGKPVAMLLLSMSRSCSVSVCHSRTKDLEGAVRKADVLFAAVGKPEIIKGEWIKEGAIVIDVGINRIKVLDENGEPVLNDKGKKKMRTVGDVEYAAAAERASKITPVPGGVGPMTTAILMRNTLDAAKRLK